MEEIFRCPKCGFEQPRTEECIKCGIVIQKYIKVQNRRDIPGGSSKRIQAGGEQRPRKEAAPPISPGPMPSRKTEQEELQGIGELFKRSWEIYKSRIGSLMSIILLSLVFAAITVGVFVGIGFLISMTFTDTETKKTMTALGVIIGIVPGTIVLFLGFTAFIYAVANENLGIKDSFTNGRRRLWSFLWILTLLAYVVTGGFFLFLVPGVIFWVWFSFALFILASEDERGMSALLKSKEYVRGRWFDVFLRLFIIAIISNVIGILPFIGPLLSIIFIPFGAIFTYLVYSDLRDIKRDVTYPSSGGTKCKWIGVGTLGYVVVPIIIMIFIGTFVIGALTGVLFNFMGVLRSQQEITIKPEQVPQEAMPEKIMPPAMMQSSAAELEGTWTMTRKTGRGAFELTFTGNDFDFKLMTEGEIKNYKRGQVVINESTMPERFDLRIAESSENKDIGKIALGIFKIENNILTMCINEPGETWRPSAFAPQQLEMPRNPDIFCIKLAKKSFLEQAGIEAVNIQPEPEDVHMKVKLDSVNYKAKVMFNGAKLFDDIGGEENLHYLRFKTPEFNYGKNVIEVDYISVPGRENPTLNIMVSKYDWAIGGFTETVAQWVITDTGGKRTFEVERR